MAERNQSRLLLLLDKLDLLELVLQFVERLDGVLEQESFDHGSCVLHEATESLPGGLLVAFPFDAQLNLVPILVLT